MLVAVLKRKPPMDDISTRVPMSDAPPTGKRQALSLPRNQSRSELNAAELQQPVVLQNNNKNAAEQQQQFPQHYAQAINTSINLQAATYTPFTEDSIGGKQAFPGQQVGVTGWNQAMSGSPYMQSPSSYTYQFEQTPTDHLIINPAPFVYHRPPDPFRHSQMPQPLVNKFIQPHLAAETQYGMNVDSPTGTMVQTTLQHSSQVHLQPYQVSSVASAPIASREVQNEVLIIRSYD